MTLRASGDVQGVTRGALLALAVAGCAQSPAMMPAPTLFASNCTVRAAADEARLPAGHLDDRSAILPGGRKVSPSGTILDVGGFPIALQLVGGAPQRYVALSDDAVRDQALRLVDLQAADPIHPTVSQVAMPIQGGGPHVAGMFFGLAATPDGKRLFVSNGGWDPIPDAMPAALHENRITAYDVVGDPPKLVENAAATIKLSFARSPTRGARLPAGLRLSGDGQLLYVANQNDSTLSIVSLAMGMSYGAEIGTATLPGVSPYDVVVHEPSHTAFVSLWGGQQLATKGQYLDGVVPVDVSNPKAPAPAAIVPTGKASEAEVAFGDKVYVVNSDADTVSVIDAVGRTSTRHPVGTSPILEAAPGGIAIDPGGGRIYVADSNQNAVVVLDRATMQVIGHVPTGWYPTAVVVRGDGSLVIASARGLGFGPYDGSGSSVRTAGILQVLPRPTDDELKRGTRTVADNLDRPAAVGAHLDCPADEPPASARFPLPAQTGAPSAIRYVFLIVRENKTYDSVFGDLGIGNGDPSLMMWDAHTIPNARALARQFVLLDNFYSHAELSIQGHEWTTGDIANDYVEKGWGAIEDYGRGFRSDGSLTASATGRLAFPGSGSIFTHLDQAGIRYHNYGEVTNLLDAKIGPDGGYPGVFFNTTILDVVKEDYIVGNILGAGDGLEPFSYLLLPNDHTDATKVLSEHPSSMMADNDEATGKFVDAISHSPLWPASLILIVEDDPGGNGDHVEQHRSICLIASPWVKRGYVSSSIFDMGSVYRTILLALGAPPLNGFDVHAAPFYELFSTTPDLTPYTFVPRGVPPHKNTPREPMAEESGRFDTAHPDRADFSRALWKVTHGESAEPPWLRRVPALPGRFEGDTDGDE